MLSRPSGSFRGANLGVALGTQCTQVGAVERQVGAELQWFDMVYVICGHGLAVRGVCTEGIAAQRVELQEAFTYPSPSRRPIDPGCLGQGWIQLPSYSVRCITRLAVPGLVLGRFVGHELGFLGQVSVGTP